MWIVKLALRRPYTFVVMALLILVLGGLSIVSMSTDIFPNINIPVVTVLWQYGGLTPDDMAKRIATYSEYVTSSTVDNIRTIESQTLSGISVIKVFLQPGANIDGAIAQLASISQTVLRFTPPGTQPPFILRYNASSVPILQLSLSSPTWSEAQLYDYGLYRVRQALAPIQGLTLPLPYGGKPRQIMVDLDPQALLAKGLSPNDVSTAITAQNLTLPSGTAKMGTRDYIVSLNSSPSTIAALNEVPIKQVNGATIYVRDIGHVRDGFDVQTNIVRQDGRRSVLLTILKSGGASTLDIVKRVQASLPDIRAAAPAGLELKELFDQSLFVRAAVRGVVTEGAIAACLTGLMILLFLGSWRSTLIVILSIPLSLMVSVITMSLLGQTLNVMTLGGLALAVGIVVDDTTVELENVHRNASQGKGLMAAILDGAQQIATPAFVSTLAICIVFVPVVLLTGPAKFLFTPMALAVVVAVLASYLLSRTIIPTLVRYLLAHELAHHDTAEGLASASPHVFSRLYHAFSRGFERLRERYSAALAWSLEHRLWVCVAFGGVLASAAVLLPFVGRDFFPSVDAGQLRLHVSAPPGTRLEETEQVFGQVEAAIRRIIPPEELVLVLDNIGVPQPTNLARSDSVTVGSADGEILLALNPEHHSPTRRYMQRLRQELTAQFPGVTFFFQPADIVNQILNFGLPAPINIRVTGINQDATYPIAQDLQARLARIRGLTDVHLHQIVHAPALHVEVDRTRAVELGLMQRDVANNLLVTLSGSRFVSPNFWADPRTGIPYPLVVQTPQYRIDSLESMRNTSMAVNGAAVPQLLSNLATFERRAVPSVVTHSNVQPVFDIYANVQDRDLGSAAAEVERHVAAVRSQLPPGSKIMVQGQVESMNTAFFRLGMGLIFAILLVYCLMVVNFQSWLDPFIIITALPGALSGIVWMLFVTRTTFSVPSLMGTIMSVGVATSNSILLVTFANDQMRAGQESLQAGLVAGRTRLRPVLMTALAMIIGMLPMSLGLGEGGEQNAPLGRAVIGGLTVATVSTLLFVPVVYSLLRRRPPSRHIEIEQEIERHRFEADTASVA
jgi:multidrug efflux pump subunit AcrB